jgi:ketosteroid isomerase-like protein
MTFTAGLLLTSLGAVLAPAPTVAASAEEVAVRKMVEQVSYATSVEEGLAAYDPAIVQDDFFGPQRRGVADVRKDFDVYMQNYSDFKAHIEDITVDVQGTLAVAYSHQHFRAKGKNGTPDLDTVVRQTDVLHKAGGKWLITYEHLSLPIDLKTGKATLNRAMP